MLNLDEEDEVVITVVPFIKKLQKNRNMSQKGLELRLPKSVEIQIPLGQVIIDLTLLT